MNNKPSLILFDIDRTLIIAGKGGIKGLKIAVKKVLGGRPDFGDINLHGATFLQIVKDVCARDQISFPDQKKLKDFYDCFDKVLQAEIGNDGVILPGVKDLLIELERFPNITKGIITGNTASGSDIKLKAFGIDSFFQFGAFGDEDAIRANLVRLAIKKAENVNHKKFDKDRIFVVGDTPADIEAAKANNVLAVGVATGHYSKAVLKDCGADITYNDFADYHKFVDSINSQI